MCGGPCRRMAAQNAGAVVSFALIRLFLGGALKKLVAWLSHRSFWQLMFGAALLVAGVQTMRLWSEQRHSVKVERQLSKSEAARKADRDAYAKAQAAAAAKNKAQVAHIKQAQQEITDATVSRLNSRLELIRGELRKPAPQGAPGSAPAGDPGSAPCRATDPAWLCLSPSDRLRAAESEERHDELIDWTILQSKVKP
jgi:hypothetical protein